MYRVGDELCCFDRRQTRIDGVDLHLVAGDVRHRVNRQLGQLPNAEAGDREEDEQDRPACADGERNETCNHGLFLLARALAELGLEQECILSCDHLAWLQAGEDLAAAGTASSDRSEERRVGNGGARESKSRWWPYH